MKRYWFKRKRYGWGWMPVTWQGWLAVLIYAAFIIAGAYYLETEQNYNQAGWITFITVFVVATGLLLTITHYTAPSAKWRWGKKDSDNPEEDV